MVNLLFRGFLDSPDEYKACEAFWQKLVEEILQSIGQSGKWPRWIPPTYADGKTLIEPDGSPIFDGKSARLHRAFRVMQHPATTEDEPEIFVWLKSYEKEYEDLPRNELVLNLSLSTESADLARRLLSKWLAPATTVDEMQALIEAIRS
jgi:hypothetical protein